MYDVIIVGSGMAGLFAAYQLKKRRPQWSILILEKNGKIGGRADNEMFYGTPIAIGAGIGRLKKDRLLAKLMRELDFPINTFMSGHHSLVTKDIDVQATLHTLRQSYEGKKPTTFAKFAHMVLGNANYQRFLRSTGFTDYQEADTYDTLYEYGMEDNFGEWKAFSVPWHDLGQSMYQAIGPDNFSFHKQVTHIEKNPDGTIEVATLTRKYQTKKVVVATTIDTLRKLFPNYSLYNQIEGQPFLRVYGKFDKASVEVLKDKIHGMTYVDFPVQKIIPMNVDKGVYMIIYNDNQSALELKGRTENTPENCRFYERLLEDVLKLAPNSLHLINIRSFYWEIGTHYYKPLAKENSRASFIANAQRPTENVFVVGELISRNQGWTEGCLESVAKILPEIVGKH